MKSFKFRMLMRKFYSMLLFEGIFLSLKFIKLNIKQYFL